MTCIFFGHHDCPASIKPKLLETIKKQIEQGTTQFYVGNHGNFDVLVLSCLRDLKQEFTKICYAVVLAYIPTDQAAYLPGETVFPEGIESIPPRFAIDFRNRWMLAHTDTIIAYAPYSFGRATKYVEIAQKRNIIVIDLAKNKT